MFVNAEWLDLYANCPIDFLPQGISNHYPCEIKPFIYVISTPKSFRFYNMWMQDSDFISKVAEV